MSLLKELAFMCYGDDGRNVYPSIETLMQYTGLTRNPVRNALRWLEREGYLLINDGSRNKGGVAHKNKYTIVLEKLPLITGHDETCLENGTGHEETPLELENGSPDDIKGSRGDENGSRRTPDRLDRPTHKQDLKPSAGKLSADTRHSEIRQHIKSRFTEWTGLNPAPWSGRDAKALDNFLKANSKWPVEKLKELVDNRFDSEENQADPAYKWIPQLQKYVYPLDKWGKPVKPRGFSEGLKAPRNSDVPLGRPQWDYSDLPSKTERRIERNREKLAVAVAEVNGIPLPSAAPPLKTIEVTYGMSDVAEMLKDITAKKRLTQ
jgi:hypothetical protein